MEAIITKFGIIPAQPSCPDCGSTYLAELNSVEVAIDIEDWENFEPKKYGSKEIFWDNAKILDPKYLCKECGNEFNPNVRDILGLKDN